MYPTKRASPLQESFVYSTMTEVYTYEHKPIDVYTYVCTYIYTHIYIYTYTPNTTDESALTTNQVNYQALI